jgi:uncharacterized protein YuzE
MISSSWDGTDLVVKIEDDIEVLITECVLDLDEFGDAIGIEFLNLISQYGDLSRGAGPSLVEHPPVSVDPEAGAVYVRLSKGRSASQPTRRAIVVVSATGRILAVRVMNES